MAASRYAYNKLTESSNWSMCHHYDGRLEDTAQHMLKTCPVWAMQRAASTTVRGRPFGRQPITKHCTEDDQRGARVMRDSSERRIDENTDPNEFTIL
ncbi:hypothetical protein EVAR_57657_1 [Eumeta japonica]|uniref:Uncharacterized protein n=1 Tax=Eumeta variegata TaxID=151549 RepID=A0A4C1YZN5_EUMVA|nr:hypothetical protein EVAR_57657_1 [Eumeta japonica]